MTEKNPKIPNQTIKDVQTINAELFREHITGKVFDIQKQSWNELQKIRKAVADSDFSEAEKLLIHSAKFRAYLLSEKILMLSQILM